jgi:phytoene synthase
MTVAPSDVDAIRARVSGSSFYAAMRLMPKAEREAMFAIYMFCRLVDDKIGRASCRERV